MKEILSSQFDAVSGDGRIAMAVEKRSSDNGGSGSSARGGNNGGDRGLQSFLSKTALMAAVPAPVVSGEWQFYRKWVWRQWHWTERDQRIRNQTLINS